MLTPEPAVIAELYDQNRFVDAYRATSALWGDRALASALPVSALVLGGRLAHRLGNPVLANRLHRLALARDPSDADAQYFGRFVRRRVPPLLRCLEQIEAIPPPAGLPACQRASWLAVDATCWAGVREMGRARTCIEAALALECERAWVQACLAQVLMAADDWGGALGAAEQAWELSPGMPAAATALAAILPRCGRTTEAAERLYAASSQSYEVALAAVHCCCAAAEQCHPDGTAFWAGRAGELAERLPTLAPLAGRQLRRSFALVRVDAALLRGDHYTARATVAGLPFPGFRRMVERLSQPGGGPPRVLPFRAVRQKHDTCLPSSIAAVLGGFGEEFDADALATALTYGGTPLHRAAEWLRERGYCVRSAIASPELCRELIARGVPFVLCTSSDSDAHAVAAIGIDPAAGLLILHDPSSPRWSRLFLDALGEGETPLGPEVMVVLPPAQCGRLDGLAEDFFRVHELCLQYRSAWEKGGAPAAALVLSAAGELLGVAPLLRFAQACHASAEGGAGRAVDALLELARQWPECIGVRRMLIAALRQTGNTARLRDALREVVECGRLPGLEVRQAWRDPPPTYVAQYADLLGLSAATLSLARRFLGRTLARAPLHAEAYHVLGDLLCRDLRWAESVLPLRIAAALQADNCHYAWSAAGAIRLAGREGEAIGFLTQRAERLTCSARGVVAWTTLVDALEEYGCPEQAAEVLAQTLANAPRHEGLLAHAARFWSRFGRWDEVSRCLEALRETGFVSLHLETACVCLLERGDGEGATALCAEWLARQPGSLEARTHWLRLVARRDGRARACEVAAQWLQERPEHEQLEDLLMHWQRSRHDSASSLQLLRARVRRNPEDAWAWRELGHLLMDELEAAGPDGVAALAAELEEVMAACARTCPEHESTLFLRGRLLEREHAIPAAIEVYLTALRDQPTHAYGYQRVCRLAAGLPRAEQDRLVGEMERAMLGTIGHLYVARDLAFAVASRRGLEEAEARLQSWLALRHDDPELTRAYADTLLEYGQGRRDAERAVELLLQGTAQFPAHADLRLGLARAYAVLLREDDEIAVLRGHLERCPTDNGARFHLAGLLDRRAEDTAAAELLREAVRIDPLDGGAWQALADFEWDHGRPLEAIEELRRGAARLPEHLGVIQALVDALLRMGQAEAALDLARKSAAAYAHLPGAWLLLARALARCDRHTDALETERAFRTALVLDVQFFEAADELAVFLAGARRFSDARAVLERQLALQADVCATRGRLAWLSRQEGKHPEAYAAMGAVLQDFPRYEWGWCQLLAWVEADQDWSRGRELLATWPGALMDLADLRARRLAVLAAAGIPPSELDAQWDELLQDFPQDLGVHLRRFESLWDRDDTPRAAALLAALERYHPAAPTLLARKVMVCMRQVEPEAAVRTAVAVWTHPDDSDRWASLSAWDTVSKAGWADAATEAIGEALRQNYRVQLPALGRMLDRLASEGRKAKGKRPRGAVLLRLRGILVSLDCAPWDAAAHRAMVLKAMAGAGFFPEALEYWRENQDTLARQTVVWQEIGHILTNHRPNEAVAFLAPWRDMPGVEMFIVANYAYVLRTVRRQPGERLDLLRRLLVSSRDALATLHHDHTARFLACCYCEAALRLGLHVEFLAAMDAYHAYLEMPAEQAGNAYMPDDYAFAPAVLSRFACLLREASADAARVKVLYLEAAAYAAHDRAHPAWVAATLYRCLRQHPAAGSLLRLRARVGALFSI